MKLSVLSVFVFLLALASPMSAQVSQSSHAQTWILGIKVGRAAVAYGNRADPEFIKQEFAAAQAAAKRLGVKLDPLPSDAVEKDARVAKALVYLLKLPAWQEINDKHGDYHGKIFEGSMKANLLYWFYDTDDNAETQAIVKVLTSISDENETVQIAVQLLLETIAEKKDYNTVSDGLDVLNTDLTVETVATTQFLQLGDSLQKDGDYLNAAKRYSQAILSDPGFSIPYFKRGFCYVKIRGKEASAVIDFTKFIQIAKKDGIGMKYLPSAFLNRGIAYSLQGKNTLALNDLDEAIRLDPLYGNAFRMRSMVNQALGKITAAKKDIDMAIRLGSTGD